MDKFGIILLAFAFFFFCAVNYTNGRPTVGEEENGKESEKEEKRVAEEVKGEECRVEGKGEENGEKDRTCAVCLAEMMEGSAENGNGQKEKVKLKVIRPCQHKFHESCVDTWLSKQNSCPKCRAQVPEEDRPRGALVAPSSCSASASRTRRRIRIQYPPAVHGGRIVSGPASVSQSQLDAYEATIRRAVNDIYNSFETRMNRQQQHEIPERSSASDSPDRKR